MTACTLEQTQTVIRGRCQCPSARSKSQWTEEMGSHCVKAPRPQLDDGDNIAAVALPFFSFLILTLEKHGRLIH